MFQGGIGGIYDYTTLYCSRCIAYVSNVCKSFKTTCAKFHCLTLSTEQVKGDIRSFSIIPGGVALISSLFSDFHRRRNRGALGVRASPKILQ